MEKYETNYKHTVFWDVMPCSSERAQGFGGNIASIFTVEE
jgi:hypothetical protein